MKVLDVVRGTGYWKINVRMSHEEHQQTAVWCQQHQCGKRVSINQFAFRDEAEITMFRLKWETE